jgi:hypothetical protein
METKILCPQWGLEHLPAEDFFSTVKNAGYAGVDTWRRKRKKKGENLFVYCKNRIYPPS